MRKMYKDKQSKELVDHWVDLLYVKNYLATLSEKELCDYANDTEFFQDFLKDLTSLFQEEPAFLLLNDQFLQNILNVVNDRRFQNKECIIFQLSNQIVLNANSLLWMSDYDKELRISHYLLFQEECRKRKIHSIDHLIEVNANDSVVFTGIENGVQYLSTFDTLSDLNYFTYMCPECFYDDDFYNNTLLFLNSYCDVPFYKKVGKNYRYAVETRRGIQKIKKS